MKIEKFVANIVMVFLSYLSQVTCFSLTRAKGGIHTSSIANSLLWRLRGAIPTSLSRHRGFHASPPLFAAPKRGSIVDSYRTIGVSCSSCRAPLFKYKKKNGTKSSLVKMYIERIVDDPHGILESKMREDESAESRGYFCNVCDKQFGRAAQIKGLPAIKIIGNRIRMK